jgi:hypothetical protein
VKSLHPIVKSYKRSDLLLKKYIQSYLKARVELLLEVMVGVMVEVMVGVMAKHHMELRAVTY